MTSTNDVRRRAASLASGGVALVLVAACGFEGPSSIPLPGGEGNGDDAYQVLVEFSDVLDLVPQSAVKVDDVTVGSVREITLDGYTADVTISINGDVQVPANSAVALRQTSLLGEKFVSLQPPPPGLAPARPLRDGDVIGLEQTTRSAEVEEVLGALSLVLNGGSLEQLQVINREVVAALQGREPQVKGALNQLETFVGGLDAQKEQIVRVLDGLDRLSSTLVTERQTIATALEDIPPGVESFAGQREDLVALLTGLDRLEDAAVRVIDQTQANTVANLKALTPILEQLNAAGKNLPDSFELLTTYPFPGTVGEGIRGDYANLFVTLDLESSLDNEGVPDPTGELPTQPPVPIPTLPPLPAAPPVPDAPPVPGAPGRAPVPPLPGVPVPELPDAPGPGQLPRQPGGVQVPELDARLDLMASSLASSSDLMRLLLGGLS
jgi:phospholipid/cholesterol/gamma-HCH transport system substrate-binding protein